MKIKIGIDEVGRGPLAGPVTVAAACILNEREFKKRTHGFFLRDSKKLSAKQRIQWMKCIQTLKKDGVVEYAIASLPPRTIDAINISAAANRAATRAARVLIRKMKIKKREISIMLDAGLHVEKKFLAEKKINSESIIKGDEKIREISLASIIAKVTRDMYMVTLDKKFPGYAFGTHKGYGTEMHRKIIRKKGPSPAHRLTFIRNFTTINK